MVARDGSQRRPPVVWDSVDCISLLFKQAAERSKRIVSRWMTQFELGRTRRYEGWLARQFPRVLVTSKHDREGLLEVMPRGASGEHIRVLPNGVDLAYYTPFGAQQEKECATLVISGKMSYHANVTMTLNFAENILPLIWSKRPDVKLMVVGKDPTPALRALAKNPSIQVTGTVDDIRPYLHRATLAVTPIMYGAGIQNKVLEAMACGLPVVSTAKAVSALNVAPGSDLMVADSPEEMSNAVLRLLDEPELRAQMGQAGRKYVEKNHQWSCIAARLEEVYHEVIAD
jgi:glycosyltransferase involved in cell wall biosynthesis